MRARRHVRARSTSGSGLSGENELVDKKGAEKIRYGRPRWCGRRKQAHSAYKAFRPTAGTVKEKRNAHDFKTLALHRKQG
jgi:hypothetical protein